MVASLVTWRCHLCGHQIETLATARSVICVRRRYHPRGERAVEMQPRRDGGDE